MVLDLVAVLTGTGMFIFTTSFPVTPCQRASLWHAFKSRIHIYNGIDSFHCPRTIYEVHTLLYSSRSRTVRTVALRSPAFYSTNTTCIVFDLMSSTPERRSSTGGAASGPWTLDETHRVDVGAAHGAGRVVLAASHIIQSRHLVTSCDGPIAYKLQVTENRRL